MQKSPQYSPKSEINNIIKCIFGTHGEYFPEFGGLQNLFCKGVFFSYYANHKEIKNGTIQKYINGTSPFPVKLKACYAKTDGNEYLYQGVMRIVDACMCTERLRAIQTNLHSCIKDCNTIDDGIVEKINKHYIAVNASRLQIATYLSNVLFHLLPSL